MDTERMLHWIYEGGGARAAARSSATRSSACVSMPLFIRTAEAFLHSRKPVRTLDDLQGPEAAHRRRLARDVQVAGRRAGHHARAARSTPRSSAARSTPPSGARSTRTSRTGFHKVAKYVIIPGVHQPTAPFELCINKDAWAKLSRQGQEARWRSAAKLVTFDSLAAHRPGGRQGARLLPRAGQRDHRARRPRCSTPTKDMR